MSSQQEQPPISRQHESNNSLCSFGAHDRKPVEEQDVNAYADKYAEKAIKKFHHHSHLACTDVPSVSPSDIHVGEDIGEGGFAVVTDVEMDGKHYAMKHLRPSVCASGTRNFSMAAADLLTEAEFESAFQNHPHIVSVHAKYISHDHMGENFIIIDRLTETLEQRIRAWSKRGALCKTLQQRKQFLTERLQIALDICETLHFLHGQNVIFRDLKAENLGFDPDGTVKLFDFGLAKELKDDNKSNSGKYKLTGKTGSQVYMAPEVAKGWKYDNKVDVYSYGILLWEMVSLQLACREEKSNWQGEVRDLPEEEWWPQELKTLIRRCCAAFPSSRPDSEVVETELRKILETLPKAAAPAKLPVRGKKLSFLGRRSNRRDAIETEKKSKDKTVKTEAKGKGFLRRFRS